MRIFSFHWRARVAPAFAPPRPANDAFGRLLPFNAELEGIAGAYCVWRIGDEPDRHLARRAALAICEKIEAQSQLVAAMEAELDAVLAYDKECSP